MASEFPCQQSRWHEAPVGQFRSRPLSTVQSKLPACRHGSTINFKRCLFCTVWDLLTPWFPCFRIWYTDNGMFGLNLVHSMTARRICDDALLQLGTRAAPSYWLHFLHTALSAQSHRHGLRRPLVFQGIVYMCIYDISVVPLDLSLVDVFGSRVTVGLAKCLLPAESTWAWQELLVRCRPKDRYLVVCCWGFCRCVDHEWVCTVFVTFFRHPNNAAVRPRRSFSFFFFFR